MAQAYNRPFHVREVETHSGDLGGEGSFLEIQPPSVLLSALKPLGNPMASQAGTEADPGQGLLVRLQESGGRPTEATVRAFTPLSEPFAPTCSRNGRPTRQAGGGSGCFARRIRDRRRWGDARQPVGFAGLRACPTRPPGRARSAGVCRLLAAQQGSGAARIPAGDGAGLSSERLVERAFQRRRGGGFGADRCPGSGAGRAAAPPGWSAEPAQRLFRLAPGAHLQFSAEVSPAVDAESGRYFVAARIGDEGGQVHEDTVTVEYRPDGLDAPTENGAS